ncbi:uncharacterized protein METZ01_LOCUS366023, partial [marine metagenome]
APTKSTPTPCNPTSSPGSTSPARWSMCTRIWVATTSSGRGQAGSSPDVTRRRV